MATNIPQTPNFKLYKPPFDKRAWHGLVNDNFSIIDAVLATYLDVLNIRGVWENSTSYAMGDRAVDPDAGQVFEAAQDHISSASPITFEEERVANPTFWTSLAVTARGLDAWLPGTAYQPNDFVVDGPIYAVCIASHTSGPSFAGDAVYWDYLLDASTLPTLPSLTGKSLNFLRVDVGETGTEWITPATVLAAIGAAAAVHNHVSTDISDSSVIGRGVLTAADALAAFDLIKQLATSAYAGAIEIATNAEALAATATDKALVPSNLAGLSGTYTPTITNGANVAASTPGQCQYVRVGNVVTVSGAFDVDPTASATLTVLAISLPIASNFSTAGNLGGVASVVGNITEAGGFLADTTNDRATLSFLAATNANHNMAFTFTYLVQ